MRDGYMLDDPRFAAWKAGHRHDPDDRASWWRPWLQTIADTTARGVVVRRARIVSEPVSEYIRFEYDITFTNTAAGEQVSWLPRREATDLCLPGNDFWVIDDRVAMIHHFSGDGDFVSEDVTATPAVVKLCADAFEAVWARAYPHEHYRPH
ncbi:DUF6879 family protein [Streptacidiphilus rugosus]|uniref:DUF6879 family protein n=1 Tax=Streptacidiphilus rugosus TaxID=405783 RepID=UPI001E45E3BD|nr:DUF6879 family protein [Streptacidiphilus rugosus]